MVGLRMKSIMLCTRYKLIVRRGDGKFRTLNTRVGIVAALLSSLRVEHLICSVLIEPCANT